MFSVTFVFFFLFGTSKPEKRKTGVIFAVQEYLHSISSERKFVIITWTCWFIPKVSTLVHANKYSRPAMRVKEKVKKSGSQDQEKEGYFITVNVSNKFLSVRSFKTKIKTQHIIRHKSIRTCWARVYPCLGPFLESAENFRAHLGWHNSLCIFKTKASRGLKLCSCFNVYSFYNIRKTSLKE